MTDLLDTGILLGYFLICLVGLYKRDSKTFLFSLSLLVILGLQVWFATFAKHFEGLDNMWKFYGVMFLVDGLQLMYLSTNTSKESVHFIVSILIMCILSFLVMFESYYTVEETLLHLLYTITIPIIHLYMLARLIIGAGGSVKGIRNNSSTRSGTDNEISKNSFGGLS